MSTAAIITTLNEEATIGDLVRDLRDQGLVVYVVDDSSTDRTCDEALVAGARLLSNYPLRLGIGPSLMAGWRQALDDGADRLLQIDAGGSHDPYEAHRLLGELVTHDMVIGSRFCPGAAYIGGVWWRPWASRLAACAFSAAHGGWRWDWTSGYRAFTANAARTLLAHSYRATMHGWQAEVLAWAGGERMKIKEVPITYRAGRSSLNRKVAHEAIGVWLHVLHHLPPRGGWSRGQGCSKRSERSK